MSNLAGSREARLAIDGAGDFRRRVFAEDAGARNGAEPLSSWLKNLLDLLKQPAYFLCAIAVMCCLVLFLPTSAAHALGLDPFRAQYKPWVGLALLMTGGIGLTGVGKAIFDRIHQSFISRKTRRIFRNYLFSLSVDERGLLVYCLATRSSTLLIEVSNPIAQSLCHKRFLEPSIGLAVHPLHPHVIPMQTWKLLRENEDAVLSGKTFDDFRPYFQLYETYLKRFRGE